MEKTNNKVNLFKEFNLENLKNVNIQEVGRNVTTRITNIKDEFKEDFCPYESEWENEDWYVTVEINNLDVLIDENDFEDYGEYDSYEVGSFIADLIKKAEHYLVVAYNYTWNGKSGYKITDNLIDCFARDYDCSQYVMGGSKGKKVLSIKESHHDNPMGAETIIIALTDKEYQNLEYKNWEDVMSFGNTMRKRILYI